MNVTVLGMGRMGRAVALRLLFTGHAVTVWNRTPGRAPDVIEAGGREAATIAQAIEGTDSAHLALADDAAVEAVVFGSETPSDGIAGALGDTVLVDHSTVAPTTSRRVSNAVGPMIAAPILGAPQAVEAGTAFFLLAGSQGDVDSLGELWSSLSGQAHHFVGEDPGTATTLKLLANYLLMSGLATLAEAVATGQASGIDDVTLSEFFGALPLVAPALHNRLGALFASEHDGWFATTLGAKDVRLTVEMARTSGVTLPLAELIESRYEQLGDIGLAEADISAIIELLR